MSKTRQNQHKLVTKYDRQAKQIGRQYWQRAKQLITPHQWAGFVCPTETCQPLEPMTELDGYLFGGSDLKCYRCGRKTEFFTFKQKLRLLHAKSVDLPTFGWLQTHKVAHARHYRGQR